MDLHIIQQANGVNITLDQIDMTPIKIDIITSSTHLTYNDIRYKVLSHEVYVRGQVDMVTLFVAHP